MEFCKDQVWSDCEELLRRFQQTESVRFEVFSTMWREMKFSHIFYGALNHEKRLFSRLVLDLAHRFFMPPFSFQIRVGGLYLLYSLYQSQTASPPEQIRVALKDWEDVKRFEKDAVDAQHFDVVYVFRQLESCKAFHFTTMPTPLAYRRKRKVQRTALREEFMERACRPQEVISMDLLEELSNVHQLYNKLKKSVVSPASGSLDSSLNLVHGDFVPKLRGTVVDFYKWQQKKDIEDEEDDSGEGPSSQEGCSRRAQLLASIKSKAYGEAAEACKSRRHRQVEVDFRSNESGAASTWTRTRTPKPSLKARTNESVRLSGKLLEETKMSTAISRLAVLNSTEKKPREYKRFKWT